VDKDKIKKDDFKVSEDNMRQLKELSKKTGKTIDELISEILNKTDVNDSTKKANSKKTSQSSDKNKSGPKIDVTADLSKLLPHNNPEALEILRRISESLENIEREHAQGWSDQRKDLQAISNRMDKLM